MNQQEFEKTVMKMLLRGEDPVLMSLRDQYHNSIFVNREFSGAGFFTRFKIKKGVPPLADKQNFEIGDVDVNLGNIKNAIGVILFIRNGYLSMLEGYELVMETWPDYYSDPVLEYDGKDGKRDYEKLKAKLS